MSGNRPAILVVEDDPALADQIRWALEDGYRLELAHDRPAALRALQTAPDLVLVDLCLPPDDVPEEGFRILRAARDGRDTQVIVMSGLEEREPALRAVEEGAYDFFTKPLDLKTLRVVVARALERQCLERENRRLRAELRQRNRIEGIVGASPAMQRVFDAIQRVADSPVTVSLYGESGTGKEIVARAIHYNGCRREGPFVPVHCAALPETLLEAELFGHEKGAFTGAAGSRIGRFEAASGGTLFLDELGCLTAATQVKLLRVLEDRTVERLGSNRRRKVDIRLVAATNEDLEKKVSRGEFREDLFFRINVFPIRLPPLRERREDVPLLADHFVRELCRDRRLPPKKLSPEAVNALMRRRFPGNVRELLNVIETAMVMADGELITAADLPVSNDRLTSSSPIEAARRSGLKAAVREFEKSVLEEAIARAGGVKARAARDLGLDPSQMKYLSQKHGL